MALTPTIYSSQFDVLTVVDNPGTQEIRTSQFDLLTIFNFPSEQVDASQFDTMVTMERQGFTAMMEVSQFDCIAILRGAVDDPTVRAWTFTLDGHDFYVLKLGNTETLVYDVFAEQWYIWGTRDTNRWRAFTGHNWLGGRRHAEEYGSNILVGDESNGALYFLNPMEITDDDPVSGADVPRPFLREIMGQIPMRGYDMKSCYGVSLMGAIGETADVTLTAITLFTSDDEGHSYDEHETLNIDPGDYPARADWNSGLGSFAAPGRLFLIQDRGALQRIDWLDMATDEE